MYKDKLTYRNGLTPLPVLVTPLIEIHTGPEPGSRPGAQSEPRTYSVDRGARSWQRTLGLGTTL